MKKIMYAALALFFCMPLLSQDSKDATINALRNEIKNLISVNEELRDEINRLKSSNTDQESTTNNTYKQTTGEEYRIQLGIQNSGISSLSSPKPIAGAMVNGKMVYDIGGFRNPNEAFYLSQELRKLNLSGSFVTRYVNGIRDYGYRYDPYAPQPSYTPTSYTKPTPSYSQESGELNINSKKSKEMVIEE